MREPVAETGGMSWITSTLSQPAERVAPLVLGAMLIAAGIVLLLERAQKEGVHILWPLLLVVVGATRIGTGPSEGQDDAWWLVGVGSWLLLKVAAPTLFHQAVALTIVAAGVVTCRNPLSRLGR
jgi:hypothetical protein